MAIDKKCLLLDFPVEDRAKNDIKSYKTCLYHNRSCLLFTCLYHNRSCLLFAACRPFTVSIFKKPSCLSGIVLPIIYTPAKRMFSGYTGISPTVHVKTISSITC